MAQLPEIQKIEQRVKTLGSKVRHETLAFAEWEGERFPIHKLTFGSEDPQAPVLGFIGGVHGLERIGSQVCVSLLNSFCELLLWDKSLQNTLKNVRIFFIPTVNPVGIYRKTRCNPNDVDLMRNAPIEAEKPARLLGGHRLSRKLPWYRGPEGGPMEIESQALVDAVQKEIAHSPLALTIDLHSGFGLRDRLWFPYAKSTAPFPDLPLMYSLKELLDNTYPHHFYQVEPQAKNYTTHGDLWDYIYEEHRKNNPKQKYLPLCLEMGSWMWVKKNPWQIFSAEGPFNPLIGHRHKRTLRRHNTLMDFLLRAMSSPEAWAHVSSARLMGCELKARELWYGR